MLRERLALWSLLAAVFAIRAVNPDQPIVENYVGRQIPTAMVARNLERGSGFLNPQLDTGPFPNLFLVEPPVYAQLVASIRPLIRLDLEPTGRLVSAAATTLAAWGLFGLVRRRDGFLVALLAMGSFGVFPVMIRYGRAFQPDALMLGCVLAGLRGWDEFEDRGNWRWAIFGGFVLATGLALKVTVAWALIPFVVIVRRWPIGGRLAFAILMMIPACSWYLMAWDRVASPSMGSLASSENARIWARSVSLEAWFRFGTYADLGRNLIVRSFTPIGFVLAIWGLAASFRRSGSPASGPAESTALVPTVLRGNVVSDVLRRPGTGSDHLEEDAECPGRDIRAEPGNEWKGDRLWVGWGIGCGLSILTLAGKWHHSYYWMVVAPLAAIGVAQGLASLAKLGGCFRLGAAGLGSFLLTLSLYQAASTFRTPVEWASLVEAANEIKRRTVMEQPVIAPEALLYYADCRGYRLEFDPAAETRAANEWSGNPFAKVALKTYGLISNETSTGRSPLALMDFYRRLHESSRGHYFVRFGSLAGNLRRWPREGIVDHLLIADIGPVDHDSRRLVWRDAIRGRPDLAILVDRSDFFLAETR